jgi:hypothetical protein
LADRRKREKTGLEKMFRIFCKKNHGTDGELCCDCRELLEYALQRINSCTFGTEKPICSKCPIHCFSNDMRTGIIKVMRYAGPRMFYRHPLLALCHMLDALGSPGKKTKP